MCICQDPTPLSVSINGNYSCRLILPFSLHWKEPGFKHQWRDSFQPIREVWVGGALTVKGWKPASWVCQRNMGNGAIRSTANFPALKILRNKVRGGQTKL